MAIGSTYPNATFMLMGNVGLSRYLDAYCFAGGTVCTLIVALFKWDVKFIVPLIMFSGLQNVVSF